jgi:hypothetical protein
LAPEGAVPAARSACSITSRGTGRVSNSRTLRRRATCAWNSRARHELVVVARHPAGQGLHRRGHGFTLFAI